MNYITLVMYLSLQINLCFSFRYSLPVNFQAVVLKPHRKQQKKLAEALNQMFGHLDSKFIATEIDVSMCYNVVNTQTCIYRVASHTFM